MNEWKEIIETENGSTDGIGAVISGVTFGVKGGINKEKQI